MSDRSQDIALAKALGYTVYHYDKAQVASCYYLLLDASLDPVVYCPLAAGERKTEAEAWEDVPHFSTSLDAVAVAEDEMDRRGCGAAYRDHLLKLTMYNIWGLIRATPQQRVEAALYALGTVVNEDVWPVKRPVRPSYWSEKMI
jgi:hypothetical protein